MRRSIIRYIIIISLFTAGGNIYAQCGCIGGAAVGGLTPVGGAANIGILKEGNLRAVSFLSYSYGDKTFRGDDQIENRTVKRFNSSYSSLLVGYGLTSDFTLDVELGYYFNKTQKFSTYSLSGSGFSHTTVYGKYNAISMRAKEFEWTIGAGVRIPLDVNDLNLPQHVQPSSKAYGFAAVSYLHKGYRQKGLHFVLINRAEYNAENKLKYRLGPGFINSIFVSKSILERLAALLEVRSDIKLKDSYYGKTYNDSGWNNVILSPQLNYSFNDFNVSVLCDLPVYKYYNGAQLTNSYNVGASLTWQANLAD